MKKKLLIVFLFIALFCSTVSVSAMTDQERQALIAQLQQQIAQLQAQIIELIQAQQSDSSWCHTFNETLIQGNSGAEVSALQTAMQKSGYSIPNSEVTATLFGTSTKDAVVKFQQKYSSEILTPYGYTSGTGIVGLMTRTKLNNLYGCTGANTDEDEETTGAVKCSSDYSCGNTGFTGDAFCSAGSVYQTYTTYTCKNAGKSNSYCQVGTTYKVRDTCSSSEVCSSGKCERVNDEEDNTGNEIACTSSSSCGTSGYTGDAFCQNGNAYKTYKTYKCNSPGTSNSSCSSSTADKLFDTCSSSETCSNGSCVKAEDDNDNDDTTSCNPNWNCGSWSSCINNQQTRNCYDSNYCGITSGAPAQTQSCTGTDQTTCNPNWSCGSWSSCTNSQQTRYCYDTNYCGSEANKPDDYQSCTSNTDGNSSVDLKVNGSSSITLAAGSTPTLAWASTNVDSCTASGGWSGNQPTSGSKILGGLSSSATYTLTCKNTSGNTVSSSVTINVIKVDLKINNSDGPTTAPFYTIPYNSTTPLILTWSSSGVTSCSASSSSNDTAWSGSQPIFGTKTLSSLASSNTYTITCRDSAGNTSTDSVFINISRPSVYLTANGSEGPIYLNYGTIFNLSWTSTYADSCSASSKWNDSTWPGERPTSGSFSWIEAIESQNIHTITCRDSAGNTATDSVEVRACNQTSFGASGYLEGVNGNYSNTCDSNNRQATTYTCKNGRVMKRYDFCSQGCSGGKCIERYYLPG